MVKIEEGKFYKTRDGRKVGPMERHEHGARYWRAPEFDQAFGPYWYEDGFYHKDRIYGVDIISEWPSDEQGPIRTITRKEIVPGVYGIVDVEQADTKLVALSVKWDWRSAEELREAAHLFNQLAEFLEDKDSSQ